MNKTFLISLIICLLFGFMPSYTPVTPDRTDLLAWYKMSGLQDNTTNVYGIVASGAVSEISDISGNGLDFTQATGANKGTLVTGANGLNGVSFDGGDYYINGSDASWIPLHNLDATIVIVLKAGTSSNPNAFLAVMGNSGATSGSIGMVLAYADRAASSESDGVRHEIYNGGGVSSIITPGQHNGSWTPNTYTILTIRTSLTETVNATAIMCGRSCSRAQRTLAVSGSNATYDMQLGAAGNNVVPFSGVIMEILIYDVRKDIGSMAQTMYYLKREYDLD